MGSTLALYNSIEEVKIKDIAGMDKVDDCIVCRQYNRTKILISAANSGNHP
jgi:hypothetical protein